MAERRDVIKNKKAILQGYIDMTSEKMIDKITVSDVIKKANVSRATFYAHYKDINALKDQFEAEIAKVILEVEPAWRENMLNVPLSLKANQETYLSNILKESDVDYATALAQDDKNTIYTVAEQKIVEKILK